MDPQAQRYLQPYLRAARQYGARFESLLWASPATQEARFDAIARACPLAGRQLLDAGCGRADLLDFLLAHKILPAHYVGIEAIPELAEAARQKRRPSSQIIEADFIADPARLLVGADVIIFSGSLNTLEPAQFRSTLRTAFEAATEAVAFNFLSSSYLAAAKWLTWHHPAEVLSMVRAMSDYVTTLEDYLEGDCTIAMRKPPA